MNLLNIIWALFAELMGIVATIFLWMVVIPILNIMVSASTAQYYVAYGSIILTSIVFLIVIPIMTAMSDEEGGAFKRLVTKG